MTRNRKLNRPAPIPTPAPAAPGPGLPAPSRPLLAIAIAAAIGATACGGGSGSSSGGSGGGSVDPVEPAELYEGDYQGPDDPVAMTEAEDGALAMDYAYLGYLLEYALRPHEEGEDPDCGGSATKTEKFEPQQPQAGDEVTLTTTWETTDPDLGFCAHLRRDAPVMYLGEVKVVAEGVWGEGTLEEVVETVTFEDFRITLPIEGAPGEGLGLVISGTDQRWSEGHGEMDTDSWTSIALDVEIPYLSSEARFFWFGDYQGDLEEHAIEMSFASELLDGSISTRQTGPGEFFDGICEDGPMNWSTDFKGADADSGTVNISTANAELAGDLNAVTGCGEYALSEHEGSTGISGTFTLLDHLLN